MANGGGTPRTGCAAVSDGAALQHGPRLRLATGLLACRASDGRRGGGLGFISLVGMALPAVDCPSLGGLGIGPDIENGRPVAH